MMKCVNLIGMDKLRKFHSLDEYLEYKTDGTLPNVKWIFSDIDNNAIYDNDYKGVISIDIAGMVSVQNEYQMKYFEEHLAEVAEIATIVIYCPTLLGKKGEILIIHLCKVIGNANLIDYVEYTSGDFSEMIVQNIVERGIKVLDRDKMIKVLSDIVTHKEIKRVKDAVMLAEKFVFYADYSNDVPTLDFGKAKDFKNNYCKEMK